MLCLPFIACYFLIKKCKSCCWRCCYKLKYGDPSVPESSDESIHSNPAQTNAYEPYSQQQSTNDNQIPPQISPSPYYVSPGNQPQDMPSPYYQQPALPPQPYSNPIPPQPAPEPYYDSPANPVPPQPAPDPYYDEPISPPQKEENNQVSNQSDNAQNSPQASPDSDPYEL